MPELHLYIVFIGTTIGLGLIPGPNVALIVANSIAHGTRYGLVSVAGTSSAMVPQLTLATFGASALLATMASAFEWLRWAGVAYLLYLGIAHWCAASDGNLDVAADKRAVPYRTVYWRGFWVSAANPKTLLFFGAFLPQFVSTHGNVMIQMTVLSITFIAVITIVDGGWAVLAGKARPYVSRFARLRHRISGSFYITAGIGLAFARKP